MGGTTSGVTPTVSAATGPRTFQSSSTSSARNVSSLERSWNARTASPAVPSTPETGAAIDASKTAHVLTIVARSNPATPSPNATRATPK